MKDWMDYHGGREFEVFGVGANALDDGELPKLFVVELRGGPHGVDMFLKEPDFVSKFESRLWEAGGFCILSFCSRIVGHFGLD